MSRSSTSGTVATPILQTKMPPGTGRMSRLVGNPSLPVDDLILTGTVLLHCTVSVLRYGHAQCTLIATCFSLTLFKRGTLGQDEP